MKAIILDLNSPGNNGMQRATTQLEFRAVVLREFRGSPCKYGRLNIAIPQSRRKGILMFEGYYMIEASEHPSDYAG